MFIQILIRCTWKKKKPKNLTNSVQLREVVYFTNFGCGENLEFNVVILTGGTFSSSKILDNKLSVLQIPLVGLNAYSGSRYPNVPAGRVDTWESLSVAKALDSPKSAILACMCSFNKMLEGFKSICIIGGLQPLCRYSNPATPS